MPCIDTLRPPGPSLAFISGIGRKLLGIVISIPSVNVFVRVGKTRVESRHARPALKPPPFHEQHDETGAGEEPPERAVGFGHGGGGGDGELVGEFDLGDGGEGGLGGGEEAGADVARGAVPSVRV